jgi:hypothetical protein
MRRLTLAVVLSALVGANAATAQDAPVVGRSEAIGGRSLTDWEVAWIRWAFRFPAKTLTSGSACLPQRAGAGDVWFLGPQAGDEHVSSVTCTVAAGKYLLLGVPQVVCTDVVPTPGFATSGRGLKRCARHYWDGLTDPHPRLVLDGKPLPNGAVVHTPVFRFSMPSGDNIFGRPGVRGGRAALVARAAMLRPLAPGPHTLIQGIRYRGYHNMVIVYKLNVV